MYIRARDNTNYIKKTTINIGLELGQEKPEDAFLTLREMNTEAYLLMAEATEKGTKEIFAFFKEILPSLIVSHNLYETESTLMTSEDVSNLLFESRAVTAKVVEEYSTWINFIQGKLPNDK